MRERAQRGYLLLEAMVGGAILAIVLGATLGAVATARADIAVASRRATASNLAAFKLSEIVSQPDHESSADGFTRPVINGTAYDGYEWSWTVTSLALSGGENGAHLVEVHVRYRAVGTNEPATLTHSGLRRARPLRIDPA